MGILARKDIELIAVDLDGTLLTSEKQITLRTARAINACTQRGIRVILASARPPRSVLDIHKQLGLTTCIINYNGALVYSPLTKQVILHRPIRADLAGQIVEFAREQSPKVLVSAEVLDHWFTDRTDPLFTTETAKQFKPDKVAPISEWLNCDVTKILLQGPRGMCKPLIAQLRRKFAHRITCLQTENELIQIMARGASKSSALKAVCRHYYVDLQHVMAIGDAPNDLGMLKLVSLAVAMAQAPKALRDAASFVTNNNDQNGVAQAIEWLILNQRA